MQFLSHMQFRTRFLMPIQPGRPPPVRPFQAGVSFMVCGPANAKAPNLLWSGARLSR